LDFVIVRKEVDMLSNFAVVDGLSIFYVTLGAGIPVLYIHGNTGSSRWFSRVMDLPGFCTYALDMPNFGKSSAMPREPDIRAYAEYVFKFIESMKLDKPILAGHSLGGAVAQALAVAHPDSIRAMVLIDSASPHGLVTPKDRYPFIEMMYNDKNILAQALAATTPTLSDSAFLALLVDDATAMAKPAWIGNAEALSTFEIYDQCRSFGKPVLVLWGRKDFLVSEQMARETEKAFPNSRLEIVENVGHSVVVEDPGQFMTLFTKFATGLKE
jgi:branched-chain amino acid transport system permease protein